MLLSATRAALDSRDSLRRGAGAWRCRRRASPVDADGGGFRDPGCSAHALLRHLPQRAVEDGGFVIDPAALTSVGGSAERWEKVVAKLRATSMPPAGAPRPDAATYDAVATFLETELDRAAAARPQLGKLPLAHRLSRTEYRNAVRDLLALEALPREVSIDYLLPADNISSGFDNIADLLFVSPSAWSAISTRRGRSAASPSATRRCRCW